MTHLKAICVVDDDASVRESLHGLLRSLGYAVKVFASAEEFLESEAVLWAECVFVDIQMPGIDGIQLQRQLRRHFAGMVVVFVTASNDDRIRSKAMADGAVAFLVKPVSEEMIMGALDLAAGAARAG